MNKGYEYLIESFQNSVKAAQEEYIRTIFQLLEGIESPQKYETIIKRHNPNYWVISLINNLFDPNIPLRMKERNLIKIKENNIEIQKYDNKEIIIIYNGKKIIIKSLYNNLKPFKKREYTNNPAYYKKEIYIPILIEKIKELGCKSKIVIGYIKEETVDIKKLFAWIEFSKNDKTYVIDYVNNIIIDKESFYMFYIPEILNEIPYKNIINDKLLSILVNDLNIKCDEYLIFEKEFKKEFQNKKELLLK